MNAIVTMIDGNAVTTSLAIAEGTDNEHASVIKLVRTYQGDLEEFGRGGFEIAPFETAGGTQQREFATLNEQQSTLLLTYMRNSDIVRQFKKALVKAFFDLLQKAALTRFNVPSTFPEAMRLAADLAEQKAHVEAQLALAEPKAEALDLISASSDAMTSTQAAKVLGMKRADLTSRLHAEGWWYRQNGSWVAYDKYIKNGCLEYKEAKYTDETTGLKCIKPYCHITPKGLVKLAERFSVKKAA